MMHPSMMTSIVNNIPKDKPDFFPQGHSDNVMPINFLHSPGQYNKMLIKYGTKPIQTRMEKEIGIVRNLEFINQPLFEREREKRDSRIHALTEQIREEHRMSEPSLPDRFMCQQCQDKSCKESVRYSTIDKKDLLIDVEAMKKNPQKLKRRKRNISQEKEPVRHRSYNRNPGIRVQQLVNRTLLKEIENSRVKQLDKLSLASRKQMMKEMNRTIREKNQQSLSRPASIISHSSKPTKKEVAEAYWESIKGMVGQELKKHSRMLQSSVNVLQQQAPKVFRYSAAQMKQMREQHGKEARLKQVKKVTVKNQAKREKEKRLQLLEHRQKRIVNQSPSKPFKPTPEMIEGAFQQW